MNHFVGEDSLFRKAALYIFAKYIEIPFLKTCYHVLRGKWSWLGRKEMVKKLARVLLAKPFGYLGDTARPIPYDELIRTIDEVDGPIAVGPCRCRMGHRACDHPLETDIVMRSGFHAWTKAFPNDYRQITKEEVKAIVTQCHELGMFHMVFIHCPVNLYNEYAICNCCTCGCVPYIINRDLGQLHYPLIDGYFMAVTDRDRCVGCGECVEVCPFEARKLGEGKAKTAANCFGCGLCRYACPEGAIRMKQLRDPLPPRDEQGRPPHTHKFKLYRQHEPYVEELE